MCYPNAGFIHLEIFNLFLTAFGTKNESKWWKFAFFPFVLVEPTEIENVRYNSL